MTHDIRIQRHFDVAADVAFHHWVDADRRRLWYQGDQPTWVVDAATDLRVGGRFWVRWGPTPEQSYQEDGVFEVVDPPHQLIYSSRFTPIASDPAAPLELRVTVTFTPEGDGTLLELIETGYPTTEIRDAYLRNGADQGLAFYERTLPPLGCARAGSTMTPKCHS